MSNFDELYEKLLADITRTHKGVDEIKQALEPQKDTEKPNDSEA